MELSELIQFITDALEGQESVVSADVVPGEGTVIGVETELGDYFVQVDPA